MQVNLVMELIIASTGGNLVCSVGSNVHALSFFSQWIWMQCISTDIIHSLPIKWCSWCPGPEEILLSEDAPFSRGSYREIAELCSTGKVIRIGHLQGLHGLCGAVADPILFWCESTGVPVDSFVHRFVDAFFLIKPLKDSAFSCGFI